VLLVSAAPASPWTDLDQRWRALLESGRPLVIATVQTRDLADSWLFHWRDRLIRELAPPEVMLLQLEFEAALTAQQAAASEQPAGRLTVHGVMLRQLQRVLPADALCLLIDVDAYPLSRAAIQLSFVLADRDGLCGNAQRTNCISNGEHLFIGPSYCCFAQRLLEPIGDGAWRINDRSDVGEEICWRLPVPLGDNLFRPLHTRFAPIWPLEGTTPVYGVGTTFGCQGVPVSYHHFFARNLTSRLHFCLISWIAYLRAGGQRQQRKPRFSGWRPRLRQVKAELVFGLRYLRGNPF
jgi:hypothetical protein